MELQTVPFGVGEIGGVTSFHAQERTSSIYPPRFSKQFLEEVFSETGFPVYRVLGNSLGLSLSEFFQTSFLSVFQTHNDL
jgi:hypothetical protein